MKGLGHQGDIVGGPAATAGLGHQDGDLACIILAAPEGFQNLSDDDQGRVAGIVVHELQPQVHTLVADVLKHLQIVPLGPEGLLEKLEMNW